MLLLVPAPDAFQKALRHFLGKRSQQKLQHEVIIHAHLPGIGGKRYLQRLVCLCINSVQLGVAFTARRQGRNRACARGLCRMQSFIHLCEQVGLDICPQKQDKLLAEI